MANLGLTNSYQNWNAFQTPYITQCRNTNDFLLHVVCIGERACKLLNFSMSQEVKKEPFAALIIASSQKKFLTYSQKPMWFYLLSTEDSLMGKVWVKTFFRCETPWTALTRDRHLVMLWSGWCEDTSMFQFCVSKSSTNGASLKGWMRILAAYNTFFLVYRKRRQKQVVWRGFVPLQIYIYITPIRRNPRGAEFHGNLTCFC